MATFLQKPPELKPKARIARADQRSADEWNQCFCGRPVLIFSKLTNASFNCAAFSSANSFSPARNTSLFLTCIFTFIQIALISAIFEYSPCGMVKLSRTTFFLCSFFGFFAACCGASLTPDLPSAFVTGFAGTGDFFTGSFFTAFFTEALAVVAAVFLAVSYTHLR